MSLQNAHYQGLSEEGQKKFSKIYDNRNRKKLYEELQKSHGPVKNNEEYHAEVGPELYSNSRPVAFTQQTTWSKRKKQNSLQPQNKDNGVGVGLNSKIPPIQQISTVPIGSLNVQPSLNGIGNNSAAGVLTLQQQRQQRQQSPPPTTFKNLEVPAHLVPQQQTSVIDPNTNHLIQQLNPNTFAKVKNGLSKITNQSNKNSVIGKIKSESTKLIGEIAQEKKDEIEKRILEILGGSKTEEAVKKRPNILFIVIIVLLVVGGIVAVIILVAVPKINEKIAEIRKDWPENRCKYPYVNLPSVFGPEGTTADENKAYCDSQAANSAFNSNIGGVQNQIDSQNNSIQNNTESLNNTQTMILGMRDALMKQVNDIYQKMYSMFKRIAYLFKVFARLFYRIFETFNSLFKTIKYAVWTLMSVWEGPIGGLVRAFCFGCHTLIELDGKIKRLDEIIIGDNISGDIVVGVCEFKKDLRDQYYKIGDVYVSGMHIVEHDGEFIRVHSHPRAVIVDYNLPVIRCLITDTGRLRIGGTIYCDYLGDNVLETYLKIVAPIVKIPFRLDDYKNSALNLYPAFTQDSIIQVDSGIKMITDIVIGDKIAGKEVIGVIRYILEGKTFITEYDDGYNMCKFVGIQICRGNKYVVRENHREMKILGKLECIGLVVEGGVIELSRNMRIVDFDIIGDDMRRDVEDALEKLYLD
jgi:peptidoglycan hydrolase CwlO-like protein